MILSPTAAAVETPTPVDPAVSAMLDRVLASARAAKVIADRMVADLAERRRP